MEGSSTPILKKGNPETKENYRPVSCLHVASKVLEKIVTKQMTRFLELHKLLPDNQHGFREKRSTMSALSSMQKEWTENTENNKKTGILLWDLSAAFDTLDVELLCQKGSPDSNKSAIYLIHLAHFTSSSMIRLKPIPLLSFQKSNILVT